MISLSTSIIINICIPSVGLILFSGTQKGEQEERFCAPSHSNGNICSIVDSRKNGQESKGAFIQYSGSRCCPSSTPAPDPDWFWTSKVLTISHEHLQYLLVFVDT